MMRATIFLLATFVMIMTISSQANAFPQQRTMRVVLNNPVSDEVLNHVINTKGVANAKKVVISYSGNSLEKKNKKVVRLAPSYWANLLIQSRKFSFSQPIYSPDLTFSSF